MILLKNSDRYVASVFVWLLFPKAGVIASPGAATTCGSHFQTYCQPNKDRDSSGLSARTGRARPCREPRRNRGLDAAAGESTAARLRTGRDKPARTRSQGVRRGTPRSPVPSARTGQARPVRGPGGTADLHAAAGFRWPPGSGPDGTSPTGHAARASSGERRDSPDPQPGRDEPARAEGLEEPRIRRCGGSPLAARQRTGRDKPDRSRGQGVQRGTTAIPQGSQPGRDEPDRSESPGGTADLDAAAGVRWPPGSGPDGTSPPGHAARASSGERRDPPCPLPGRDKPDRSEDQEGPRITRCGGKPPSACHGVRTGQARPYTVTGQPSGPPIAAGSAHFRSAPAARGPWPEAKATGHHRPLKRPVAMPRRRWRPPFWQTRQRWRGTPRFLESSARSDEPPGQRTRRNRGLHAAAGDRRPPGCGPDGTSPLGRAARASSGERRDPPCPLPGRDKPDRSEDPDGPRIYTLRRNAAIPQGSQPGRDEPARAESPGGTADYTLRRETAGRQAADRTGQARPDAQPGRPAGNVLALGECAVRPQAAARSHSPRPAGNDRDSSGLSARSGRARPCREPRRNRGLDAAAGDRRPPGCRPDGTSPSGRAAWATSGERPRPGRVCRSAAGGRPITLSQACGERRDPSSPQPGRTSRPVRGLEGTAD